MGAFDDLIPKGGGAFDDLIPAPTSREGGVFSWLPSGQGVVEAPGAQPTEEPQEPAIAMREQLRAMIPRSATDIAALINPLGAESLKQRQIADQIIAGRDPQEVYAENFPELQDVRQMSQAPVLSQQWWNALAGLGSEGVQMLPFALHAAAEIPSRAQPVVPELPELPPSLGPGTTAGDVGRAVQILRQRELEQSIPMPAPRVSPETGFTFYPGAESPPVMPSETASIADLIRQQPQEPTLVDKIAQAQAAQPPAVEAPLPYTREAAEARAAQPQAAPSEAVSSNVKGFAQTYGPGEIPAGPTITPEDAWDAAAERSATGKAQPYSFVDRARTGAITPEEMGDLIYEHQNLVNEAGAAEGTPQYNELYQRARTFAENVLKPAENAWHQKGQVMQIAVKPDFTSDIGVRAAAERMGIEIKASDAARAREIARENKAAEVGVQVNGQRTLDAMDREYSRGARRVPKTAEQLRTQLMNTDPCVL
jgi:hypothetical protein